MEASNTSSNEDPPEQTPLLSKLKVHVSENAQHDNHLFFETEDDDARLHLILRKVDKRLLPLMFVTYMLAFSDKSILSSAAVFGLPQDAHLKGKQYGWLSTIFFWGFFVAQFPTTVLIPSVPVAKFLAGTTVFWGIITSLTGACRNLAGLLVVRFLLGFAEATLSPAFMFIITHWYTREEIPLRTGIAYAGNAIGGLVARYVCAYALGSSRDR